MDTLKHPIEVGNNITRLVPYRPGKPIEEVKRELGLTDVVKLASNENPLGPSPKAVEALRQAADRIHLYPDASCWALRAAVAQHLGVPEDTLVFGNGSDDVIHLLGVTLLAPGDEVVQADPSFVRYEAAAILNRANCHLVPLREWTHDLDAMAQRLNERTRLIFIANPNNPTGTSVPRNQVERFLDRVPPRAVVVFDEAYYEYVDRPDYPDTLAYVRDGLNVVTLRTFSKAYGLAGLRIGYGVASPQLADYLNRVREPFNVSLVAQEAALAALSDEEHLRRSRDANRAGKLQLYRGFDALDLPYVPTDANFVWVDVRRDCQEVFLALLQRGVIVRTGDIFGAETWLRVTIGTADQNERFLTALAEVL
ncbi:MAG: histidinol-phosphate transaminase [Chthonomonadales bacterium]